MTVRTPPIHNPVEKFFLSDRQSKALAIKAMCAYCVGCQIDHLESGFRASVRDCSAKGCPLHTLRPYQRLENASKTVLPTIMMLKNTLVEQSE